MFLAVWVEIIHAASDRPGRDNPHVSAVVSGKQLVQYTAQPVLMTDPMSSENTDDDLPILLELEGDSYFSSDPADDPTISLLTTDYQPTGPENPKL